MNRAFYSDSVDSFLGKSPDEVLGALARNSDLIVEDTQRDAWLEEIAILRRALSANHGTIYFEYSIPRMGKRIDVVLLIGPAVLVLEFKVGERNFSLHALDQVTDYALDLYRLFRDPHSAFDSKSRQYSFMTIGPVSPLSFSGSPLFLNAFNTVEAFYEANNLKP